MSMILRNWGTKTFWAGLGAVLTGLGGWLTGTLDPSEAIQLMTTGVIAIFGRDAISKLGV